MAYLSGRSRIAPKYLVNFTQGLAGDYSIEQEIGPSIMLAGEKTVVCPLSPIFLFSPKYRETVVCPLFSSIPPISLPISLLCPLFPALFPAKKRPPEGGRLSFMRGGLRRDDQKEWCRFTPN